MILTLNTWTAWIYTIDQNCRKLPVNLVTKQRFLIAYDALREQKSIPSFMTGQCMENEEGEASLLLVKENRLERGSRRQRSSGSLGDALSRIDLSKSHQSFHLRRLENQFWCSNTWELRPTKNIWVVSYFLSRSRMYLLNIFEKESQSQFWMYLIVSVKKGQLSENNTTIENKVSFVIKLPFSTRSAFHKMRPYWWFLHNLK